MKNTWKLPENLTATRVRTGSIILAAGVVLGLAAGQIPYGHAATPEGGPTAAREQSSTSPGGTPVPVHSGKSQPRRDNLDLDAAINRLRESTLKNSLPSSLSEPWWRTMLHDPDAGWIMRNFDIMASDPDRTWDFPVGSGSYIPRLDISESNNLVTITAEVPGIDEKNLDVTVNDNSVTIKGDKRSEVTRKDSKNNGFESIERSYGSFERTVPLHCKVDSNKATASLKDGVLTITAPKLEPDAAHGKKLTIHKG